MSPPGIQSVVPPKKDETTTTKERLRIAMVCDFFYPRLGGVENHIYSLSAHLVRHGHKVIIVTHAYGECRKGVRYLPGPIKVYYCPFKVMTDQDTMPTFTATLPLLRHIFLRERINVVHSHQATSTLANEAMVYGSAMGIATVYTDHSLFGFGDVASLVLNRVLQVTLATADALIAVSHTCRDNLILRAGVTDARSVNFRRDGSISGVSSTSGCSGTAPGEVITNGLFGPRTLPLPRIVAVIPNAVDPFQFAPRTSNASNRAFDRIVVVVVSRLVYRKGVDLLTAIVPIVCRKVPFVDFVVGGDGNRMLQVREMIERHRLHDRVTLLGSVPHDQVRNVLVQGHVFLNCSLTESFCIALLEAACCGLLPVSTNVGGVPEVLPDDLIVLADPNVPSLVEGVVQAIYRQRDQPLDPVETHRRVAAMYSWDRVARETSALYGHILMERSRAGSRLNREGGQGDGGSTSSPHLIEHRSSLLDRLDCYVSALGGRMTLSTMVVCLLAVTLELWLRVVEWMQPHDGIDVVPDLVVDDHGREDNVSRDNPSAALSRDEGGMPAEG